MQNIFLCNLEPKAFKEANEELFPEAPERCPFSNCLLPITMKKHGFYRRYVINHDYSGYIYIRRYICPCCKRTVSFLPSFLMPYFQYTVKYILSFLNGYFKKRQSLRGYIKWFKQKKDSFSRRHFRYYTHRMFSNASLVQYYLNLTGQGIIPKEDTLDSRLFAKSFLEKVHTVSPYYLTCNFFTLTGKSILAPTKKIP